MNVLVTTPDLRMPGGVANYFGVLRPHLQGVADYHTIGVRPGRRSGAREALRLLLDSAGFAMRLVRGRYDLVHINPSLAAKALPRDAVFVLIARMLRRPVIVFLRGWDPACSDRISRRWKRLFQAVYGRADAFIVLAEQYRTFLRDMGYSGPIECETTVVPDDAFEATPSREIKRSGAFRILFLARLEKDKGIYEAFEAYRIVRHDHESAELLVAGEGAESESARRYVCESALPGVTFLGHVGGASKAAAFATADVYLFPSYYEGMPNSVLEAMAHGLPVVTHAVGGLVDFFEDGQMGFMTRTVAPEVLAAKIAALIADPLLAARISENNRAYANRFRASKVAERLVRIYGSVLERTTAGSRASRPVPGSIPTEL